MSVVSSSHVVKMIKWFSRPWRCWLALRFIGTGLLTFRELLVRLTQGTEYLVQVELPASSGDDGGMKLLWESGRVSICFCPFWICKSSFVILSPYPPLMLDLIRYIFHSHFIYLCLCFISEEASKLGVGGVTCHIFHSHRYHLMFDLIRFFFFLTQKLVVNPWGVKLEVLQLQPPECWNSRVVIESPA